MAAKQQQDEQDPKAEDKQLSDIEQGEKDIYGGPLKASLEASQALVEQMNTQQQERNEAGGAVVEVGDYSLAEQRENRAKDGEPTPGAVR